MHQQSYQEYKNLDPYILIHDSCLLGDSPSIKAIRYVIEKIAPTNATVLLLGETGAGKGAVAYEIHKASGRSIEKWVKVNCTAMPDTLLESELFGHRKGAYTGALENRDGKFRTGNGGTVYLDEVGDMEIRMQAKLLGVLEDKIVTPVGSDRPVEVDFRLIAATNLNLEEAVESGKFRQDLYYRLNIVPIEVPPLRERREDIPELASYFLKKYSQEYEKNLTLSPEALQFLEFVDYKWPGNIRELQNLMQRAVVLGSLSSKPLPDTLTPQDFELSAIVLNNDEVGIISKEYLIGINRPFQDTNAKSVYNSGTLREMTEAFQRETILQRLKEKKNLGDTAESLGYHRNALRGKMKLLNIKIQK